MLDPIKFSISTWAGSAPCLSQEVVRMSPPRVLLQQQLPAGGVGAGSEHQGHLLPRPRLLGASSKVVPAG